MQRYFWGTLSVSCLLAFSAAAAPAADPAPEITVQGTVFSYVGLIDFPECKDSKGIAASYVKYSVTDILVMSPLGSTSMGWGGEMEILYDDEWLPYLPAISQKFILAHECRHVKNYDLETRVNLRNSMLEKAVFDARLREMEDRADCEAVQELRDAEGLTDGQIDEIFNAITPMLNYYGAADEEIAARRAALHQCRAGNK